MDLGRRPRSSYLDCLGFPENECPELYTHGGPGGRGAGRGFDFTQAGIIHFKPTAAGCYVVATRS